MKKILASIMLVSLLQSCDNDRFTSINDDANSYYTTVPSTLVTYAEKQLTDYVTTPNVNTNNFRLTMQYWQETTYTDESRYDFATRNVSNSVWVYLYVRTLKNLEQARKLTLEYSPTPSEVVTWPKTMQNQLAIIDILQVYTYQILVDTYGNIPYSEALDVDAHPLPKYDDAGEIYKSLISRLQADIANLDTTGKSFSSGEKFYNGDVAKWKTFGNSLLLKLGISIADAEPALAKTTCDAAIAGGVFASKSSDALLPYLASSPNYSALYAELVASNRNDYVLGKTIVDAMNTTNDPRRNAYFQKNLHYALGKVTSVSGTTITFVPADPAPAAAPQVGDDVFNGKNKVGTITAVTATTVTLSGYTPDTVKEDDTLSFGFYYKGGVIGMSSSFNNNTQVGAFAYTATTPGILMNYTEVAFYLAEYNARWGTPADAETWYKKAVTASFDQWSAGDPSTYLAANPYNAANWKESIGMQAWYAMYNQPLQSWNFYRRLDYPVLAPAAQAVTEANNMVPVRLKYPVSEQSTNPSNYAAGSSAIGGDNLYTKIFWDKN